MNDVNCLWLVELFDFDRQSSSHILKNILNIERRLANAVSIIIEESIIQKKKIKEYNGLILKESKEIINSIFSNFRKSDKKRIIKFIVYLNKDYNNKNKLIGELFNEFKDVHFNKLDAKNNWFELFKDIFNIKSTDKTFDKIGMGYVFEENWYEIIREKIDNFSYKKLREIMSKNFKGDKKVSINKIKNKTLTTLSKEWTLGDLIKIFDSLNIDIKTKITEYM
ncbi:MAG: hypothetical protein K2I49_03320, partial [Ureaplasma sp.]|nr:hypothetical protein [Ureaplasma sp.]